MTIIKLEVAEFLRDFCRQSQEAGEQDEISYWLNQWINDQSPFALVNKRGDQWVSIKARS